MPNAIHSINILHEKSVCIIVKRAVYLNSVQLCFLKRVHLYFIPLLQVYIHNLFMLYIGTPFSQCSYAYWVLSKRSRIAVHSVFPVFFFRYLTVFRLCPLQPYFYCFQPSSFPISISSSISLLHHLVGLWRKQA